MKNKHNNQLSLDPTLRNEQLKILQKRRRLIICSIISFIISIIGFVLVVVGSVNEIFVLCIVGAIIIVVGLIPLGIAALISMTSW